MAQPDPYFRQYDFKALQPANYPAVGENINVDIDGLSTTVNEIIDNLALIQRDDGQLANASVYPETLAPATRVLIAGGWGLQGDWVTGTAYAISDVVRGDAGSGDALYVALTNHTAGASFAADVAAEKWIVLYVEGAAAYTVSLFCQGILDAANAAAFRAEIGAAASASPSFTGTAAFAGAITAASVEAAGVLKSAPVSADAELTLQSPALQRASLNFERGASRRWRFGMDSFAETGLNAGSNFDVYRYSDAGTLTGVPVMGMERSTGNVSFGYQALFAAGSAAAPSVRVGSSQSGLAQVGASTLGLVANGVEIARVSSTGIAMIDATDSFAGKNTAKAWVVFNGTGVIAILASFNVASITDGGAGSYNVNYSTALPAAYASVVSATEGTGGAGSQPASASVSAITTTLANLSLYDGTSALFDSPLVSFVAFG